MKAEGCAVDHTIDRVVSELRGPDEGKHHTRMRKHQTFAKWFNFLKRYFRALTISHETLMNVVRWFSNHAVTDRSGSYCCGSQVTVRPPAIVTVGKLTNFVWHGKITP